MLWQTLCQKFDDGSASMLWRRHQILDTYYTTDSSNDDVIKWKHFPRYSPFVRGIHRSTVNSPHKGQWRGALMFSLICVWINGWVNNREADDLRRYRVHGDVVVMTINTRSTNLQPPENSTGELPKCSEASPGPFVRWWQSNRCLIGVKYILKKIWYSCIVSRTLLYRALCVAIDYWFR